MGFRERVNSKSLPSAAGIQYSLLVPSTVLPAAPCTISMQASLERPTAAVLRRGVCAGTIESSSGSAKLTPIPRSTVRRERCLFVRYAIFVYLPLLERVSITAVRRLSLRSRVRRRRAFGRPHLERYALHHTQNKSRKAIVILRRFTFHAANRWHIAIIQNATHSVGQQISRKISQECVGVCQHGLANADRTVQFRSIIHFAGAVYRDTAIFLSPDPDGIVVLQR